MLGLCVLRTLSDKVLLTIVLYGAALYENLGDCVTLNRPWCGVTVCDLVNYVITSVVPVGVRGALYSGVTCHVGLLCAWKLRYTYHA